MTPTRLRVLIVEDFEADALLAIRELRRAGYDARFKRVESADEMTRALADDTWDLVLADYLVPGFGALEALALMKSQAIDLPFIVLSGAVGEEVVVEAMRAGAHDYVMKDRLVRLGPAAALVGSRARRHLLRRQGSCRTTLQRVRGGDRVHQRRP